MNIKKEFLFIVLLLFAVNLVAVNYPGNKKYVLVLQSYHKGFKWSDDISRGIFSVLGDKANIHTEYFDTKRFKIDTVYEKHYLKLLEYKLKKHYYDIIIACDNNTLTFLQNHASRIVGTIPIVFCGINELDSIHLIPGAPMTGINERVEFAEDFDMIKKLHPECNHLVVITDATEIGHAVNEKIINELSDEKLFANSTLLHHCTMQNVIDTISRLDENSIVYLTFFGRDANEEFFNYEFSSAIIAQHSNRPVYTAWDFNMGSGVVGGNLISGFDQGMRAAEKALRIINGEAVENIPITWNTSRNLVFDYPLVDYLQLDLSTLNGNVTYINQPDSFYERFKKFIALIVGVVSMLIVVIVFLGIISYQRRIARIKAEESDRLKTAFLANISHEIRTPMNSIVGFSELLSEIDDANDEVVNYSRIISLNGKRLLRIIDDIIDISKIESGTMSLFPKSFNLNHLIDLSLSNAQLQIPNNKLTVNVSYGLADAEAIMYFDHKRLQQVIENLITNALKFTPAGKVDISYTLENSTLKFVVEDTGIGIHPSHHNVIFDRFRQANLNHNTEYDGSGLGLAISRSLIELMGGKISIESTVGVGSVFRFSLPFRKGSIN
jgi:two-component system, sensor histidine kinase